MNLCIIGNHNIQVCYNKDEKWDIIGCPNCGKVWKWEFDKGE